MRAAQATALQMITELNQRIKALESQAMHYC